MSYAEVVSDDRKLLYVDGSLAVAREALQDLWTAGNPKRRGGGAGARAQTQ